jgi:hypothetical protein
MLWGVLFSPFIWFELDISNPYVQTFFGAPVQDPSLTNTLHIC